MTASDLGALSRGSLALLTNLYAWEKFGHLASVCGVPEGGVVLCVEWPREGDLTLTYLDTHRERLGHDAGGI